MKPLAIEVRPLLTGGHLVITPIGYTIRVDSEITSRFERNVTFWHEVIHMLCDAAGVQQFTEQQIEEQSFAIATVAQDIYRRIEEGLKK